MYRIFIHHKQRVAMTMESGVNSTSLQASQLPDDLNKPIYLFDSAQWDKAPKVLVMEIENILHPTRNSKSDKYKQNGNALLMWN
jgi:hypothetical protein